MNCVISFQRRIVKKLQQTRGSSTGVLVLKLSSEAYSSNDRGGLGYRYRQVMFNDMSQP